VTQVTETSEAQEVMELLQFRMTTQMVSIRACEALPGILTGMCRKNSFRKVSPIVKNYKHSAKIKYFMSKIRSKYQSKGV
jgi:hypothetical protein